MLPTHRSKKLHHNAKALGLPVASGVSFAEWREIMSLAKLAHGKPFVVKVP